ncbi:hypothetical protein HU200_011495 [Digitaria exilis]|uniref:Uncharacterized protein n=1 Tax=Digitaria exilis TaxID=1010633 RepID=A0A835KMM4_9POAL|nr:hypothetical protein HU200_011495 [Digitaria exilis]
MAAPGGPAPRRAMHQLGVWSNDQDRIVFAVPAISVSVVVNHVMGRYNIPIVHDDDHDRVFLVRLPSAADVARFNGHTWTWWSEEVFFRRVLRVVHDDDLDAYINQAPHLSLSRPLVRCLAFVVAAAPPHSTPPLGAAFIV